MAEAESSPSAVALPPSLRPFQTPDISTPVIEEQKESEAQKMKCVLCDQMLSEKHFSKHIFVSCRQRTIYKELFQFVTNVEGKLNFTTLEKLHKKERGTLPALVKMQLENFNQNVLTAVEQRRANREAKSWDEEDHSIDRWKHMWKKSVHQYTCAAWGPYEVTSTDSFMTLIKINQEIKDSTELLDGIVRDMQFAVSSPTGTVEHFVNSKSWYYVKNNRKKQGGRCMVKKYPCRRSGKPKKDLRRMKPNVKRRKCSSIKCQCPAHCTISWFPDGKVIVDVFHHHNHSTDDAKNVKCHNLFQKFPEIRERALTEMKNGATNCETRANLKAWVDRLAKGKERDKNIRQLRLVVDSITANNVANLRAKSGIASKRSSRKRKMNDSQGSSFGNQQVVGVYPSNIGSVPLAAYQARTATTPFNIGGSLRINGTASTPALAVAAHLPRVANIAGLAHTNAVQAPTMATPAIHVPAPTAAAIYNPSVLGNSSSLENSAGKLGNPLQAVQAAVVTNTELPKEMQQIMVRFWNSVNSLTTIGGSDVWKSSENKNSMETCVKALEEVVQRMQAKVSAPAPSVPLPTGQKS
eukprot:CAMPEP_0184497586 /NCGR_PEP_ID=MMETSP0113_2-20130426/36973_1 /TAXON_ID=91329 /ORGANISM="Norrisiella sphaerica, Strain BC52" /LENGTH=579 /DNA_ID=CAMNT_0026884765 /DNA_START=69 /DNA_END=1808 /DNA_ORIENTATION=+